MKVKLLLIITLGILCISTKQNEQPRNYMGCNFIGQKYGDRHEVYKDQRSGQWMYRKTRNGQVISNVPVLINPDEKCSELAMHYQIAQ